MANYTSNLNLKLPLGSKYWNYDTWNENMRKLDEAVVNIQHIILENLTASQIPVSNPRLDADNMQDAIDEFRAHNSSLRYITATEDCDIVVASEGHTYIVLTFGDTVPNVRFVKTPSERNFIWMNDYPTFEPNSTYEISFLKLSAIWYKRNDAIDLSPFFEYYIENDVLYITDIKAGDWYTTFGNYNFAIPDTLLGYPVVIDAQYQY